MAVRNRRIGVIIVNIFFAMWVSYRMNGKLFIISLVFVVFAGVSWAAGPSLPPYVRSPVGSGAVPPSSVSSGLIPAVNPIDLNGNLIITGNVAGGRHFRGVVPYNAVTDFGGRLDSTSLDSFVRRSSGVGWSTPKSFHSETATVTTTKIGSPSIFAPPVARIDDRAKEGFALPSLSEAKKSEVNRYMEVSSTSKINEVWEPGSDSSLTRYPSGVYPHIMMLRPMAKSSQELEESLLGEAEDGQQDQRLEAEYNRQIEQVRFDQISDKAAELRRDLASKDKTLLFSAKPESDDSMGVTFTPEEPVRPDDMTAQAGQVEREERLDVYEQMKMRIVGLGQESDLVESEVADELAKGGVDKFGQEGQIDPEKDGFSAEKLAEIDMRIIEAKTVLGKHKTFASFSKDKFNQYLRAGENYLKQGKYYRAADSFSMASVYKPGDPLAYVGKSHALFAAGEYMSSALFLSRALEIFPEYATFKVDLEVMVGDRDKLESRIVDVEQWLKRSGAGELQFLLGYIYYQMDRLERARIAIEAAYEKMPESRAVVAVKEAVDAAIKASGGR